MRKRLIIPMLALVAVLTSCSAGISTPDEDPTEVALSFIENYDKWAQSGYSKPIPQNLTEAVSSDMLAILTDDQNWYLNGNIQQHGGVRIIESKLDQVDERHAVVTVTIDASAVTVTAGGDKTWVDYSRPIVTRFELERDATWRIASTKSTD